MDMTLTDKGIPRWMVAEGNRIKDFEAMEKVEMEKSNRRSISPGTERNTRGILFWNKPFVITRKNGERMCILLMVFKDCEIQILRMSLIAVFSD